MYSVNIFQHAFHDILKRRGNVRGMTIPTRLEIVHNQIRFAFFNMYVAVKTAFVVKK